MIPLLRKTIPLILGMALLSPLCASAASEKIYADVPPAHWAEEVIQKAGDYGLMEGFDDGTFGLGRHLSRAEFVTMLARMFQWSGTPDRRTYQDVTPDKWYYPSVELAAAAGVTKAGENFRPEEPVTRREMAEMLVASLGYDQIAAQEWATPFSDVAGEGSGYLAVAYDIGMTNGVKSFGRLLFQPEEKAAREEAAAMLVRVYERRFSKIQWLHGFYALSAYSQIDLAAALDGVSAGWAKLEWDENGAPILVQTKTDTNDWVRPKDYTMVLDTLSAAQVPVNLNIFTTDTSFFLTPEARSATIAALVAGSEEYAGITIDMEGLKTPEVRTAYPLFLSQLKAALPAGKTLYSCVQPDTWYDGYDYRAIGEACDKVILMAHDYQWTSIPASYVGTDKTSTPVTPIIRIYEALRAITHPETGVADRSKLALAISFANVGVAVDEDGRLAGDKLYRPSVSTVHTRLGQSDTQMGWSDVYLNPYIYYTTEDGGRYRLWYEDARSVEAKIQLAKMFGIQGVSLWRLGNIPNYPEQGLYFNVWDTLQSMR